MIRNLHCVHSPGELQVRGNGLCKRPNFTDRWPRNGMLWVHKTASLYPTCSKLHILLIKKHRTPFQRFHYCIYVSLIHPIKANVISYVKVRKEVNAYSSNLTCCNNCKHRGSVLTRDGYCPREIKVRIVMLKEAFNIKIPIFSSKLNIELRKNGLEHCFIRLRDLDTKKTTAKAGKVVLMENGGDKMVWGSN